MVIFFRKLSQISVMLWHGAKKDGDSTGSDQRLHVRCPITLITTALHPTNWPSWACSHDRQALLITCSSFTVISSLLWHRISIKYFQFFNLFFIILIKFFFLFFYYFSGKNCDCLEFSGTRNTTFYSVLLPGNCGNNFHWATDFFLFMGFANTEQEFIFSNKEFSVFIAWELEL